MHGEQFKIWYTPRWWPESEEPLERGFTDAAIAVLDDVKSLAQARNLSGLVPPMVLLWCILRRWNKSGRLGLAVLEECGVNRQSLEHDIEELLQPRFDFPGSDLDVGMVYELALKANQEAAALGHNYVGTEHLVLALFDNEDADVKGLLHKHGMAREVYKAKLLEILQG